MKGACEWSKGTGEGRAGAERRGWWGARGYPPVQGPTVGCVSHLSACSNGALGLPPGFLILQVWAEA